MNTLTLSNIAHFEKALVQLEQELLQQKEKNVLQDHANNISYCFTQVHGNNTIRPDQLKAWTHRVDVMMANLVAYGNSLTIKVEEQHTLTTIINTCESLLELRKTIVASIVSSTP